LIYASFSGAKSVRPADCETKDVRKSEDLIVKQSQYLGKRSQFWAKIGFVLGSFGFVFGAEKSGKIAITTSIISTYVNWGIFKIGFVLHKKG